MTPIQLRARFPEFGKLPDATIADAIARGVAQTNTTTWGALADESIGYLAAHFLALSPYGQQARLASEKGETTYMKHWIRLARLKAVGRARVAGRTWC